MIHSLATLAHEGRRADYFPQQLIQALRILQKWEYLSITDAGIPG